MVGKSETVNIYKRLRFPDPGEEIVISGIAGRFPESDNLTQFQHNLFNKVDLITDDGRRWKLDHPDIPQRTGKINHLEKFDAEFFGIQFKEAHTMDPMARMLLEHTYEAIIDAGVNPKKLRGTNTGFFLGTCYTESEKNWLYSLRDLGGYGVTGCCRAMIANRISNWLGCTGPSYSVDTACSSSLFAMDQAYRAIRTGECDAALVAGCNLCLYPTVSRQFCLLGVLSADGRCKSFDEAANGYARSEALSVIYLQKSKDAKRVYANVIHTKTNCDGYKEQGITFPSNTMQRALLEQFYKECEVPPSSLAFMEAHGTGTQVGDPVEVDAIDKVFCPGRTTPLRMGSVKSNLGHSEPASGLCSIAKIIIAMESGYIPPNLHFNTPRKGLTALEDGRIQVVTEPTPWEGGYVAINSFGFGGGNAHVLLKSNQKEKINNGRPTDNMPRLVAVSGRTVEAVTTLLNDLESRPVDVEYVALFHNIHSEDIPGHLYRGYTILPPRGLPEKKLRDIKHYSGVKRPVYFVFSGIGSQWPGMGDDLMKIPVFAKAMRKCDAALKAHDVDIIDILTNKNPNIFDNILNAFVGTAAIQIGLVDVLASMGIVPDNMIGYSVGELGCAYADGCLTAEQMILAAYFQGLAFIETEKIRGPITSVENGNGELNGKRVGDRRIIKTNDSVEKSDSGLQAKDVLTSGNIAYHSRYLETVGPRLLAYLKHVIPDPKARSEKWLSNSASRNASETISANLCSPDYLTNNLLKPVLFDNTSHLIPNDAITIEIAPHGLMQSTLKRSLDGTVTNIALTERRPKDNVEILLQAIGKMYEVGLNPNLINLYPIIRYPVSRSTPMISPLIRWEHSADWCAVCNIKPTRIDSGVKIVKVGISEELFEWMDGHVIDGRNLLPATGYLELVWETIGLMEADLYTEVSIVFQDVRFHRATTLPKEGCVELHIMVQKGTGRFEIFEGGTTVVTGFARTVKDPGAERLKVDMPVDDDEKLDLTGKDFYKELRLRGYQYAGLFRAVKAASLDGTKGRIAWDKNWVAFMDNMLQLEILRIDTRGLFVPTGIQKLVIDTKAHMKQLRAMPEDNQEFKVQVHKDLGITVCGGIEIRGLKASAIARRKPTADPVRETFKFVAHRDRAEMRLDAIARIATHIALETQLSVNIKTIELIGEADNLSPDELTSPLIQEILSDLPLLQADVNIFTPVDKFPNDALPPSLKITDSQKLSSESGALLVVGHGLLASNDTASLKKLRTVTKDGGFFMAREPLNADAGILSTLKNEDFDVLLEKRTDKELIFLLRQRKESSGIATVVQVDNNKFAWLPTLQAALKAETEKESRDRKRIVLVSEGEFESGLMGLVNCLRREPGGEVILGLLIQDSQAPKFSLENPFYSEQLNLGLPTNVLHQKLWGSYRFFAMAPLTAQPVYHAQVSQQTRGDLSALKWVEGPIQPHSQRKDLIQVYYSSLNFRDVMLGTGKLAVEVAAKTRKAQESPIGFEFSGRDVHGRPVMGMIETGALSNLCVGDKDLLWPVPDNWTLEDAATVPTVYGTAYYALFLSGNMKKGDKVLIHAGTGGVGQAAITVALHTGCEVFTTVGTPEKREFIRKQFPQIDDDHIGNSRDTSFEQLVLRKTRGQGVDIVLNSLAEEKLQASVRCLARGGRFLEIGKFDLAANNLLGMESFLKGISFHGIILDNILAASSEPKRKLTTMLAEGLENGAIKPLVRTVFPMDQVEAAFRYMAAGKHIGKVIVKVRNEDNVQQSQLPLALPRYYCSEKCSYLLIGGLGGFGLELADWLVLRGARKLVLTSRTGFSNGYQRLRINIWKSYGVKVVIVAGKDASTHEGCEAILKEARALGPVDAIFNLAVVLRDAVFENQTGKTFEESLRVKAWATKQLDKLSRTFCPHLRQFVVFSSVSCGRGNAGQTNYGMANSIMERICETRRAENLPGLAIQWGAIGDVGLVAEMQEDHKEVVIGGTLQQRISSCLQELDGFLQQDCPVVSSIVVAEKKAGSAGATNIVDAVLNIMGLKDLKSVSAHTPLAELGMDSMMAVEIKQTLEREFEVFLTPLDIRGLNFEKLEELSQKQLTGQGDPKKQGAHESQGLGADLGMLIQLVGTSHMNKEICLPLATKMENERGEAFIIPGIEGTWNVLEHLATKLKSPATCLQLGTRYSNLTSISDIANSFIPHVKARCKDRKSFVLVGYSYGSLIAIELARRLESEGLSGRLVLIDGSPCYMKQLARHIMGADNDDRLQSNVILQVMSRVALSAVPQLMADLKDCRTWDEKLNAFTRNVPESLEVDFTIEEQRDMCSALYTRVKSIRAYDSSAMPPLKAPITLLKPTIISVPGMSEDYDLGLITQGEVEVYNAKGDHVTILDNDICAAAIDGELMKNGDK